MSAKVKLLQHPNRLICLPTPMTTKKAVKNHPNSTKALLPLSIKSSEDDARPHIQFGSGATTYVATTTSGR